MKNSSNTIGNRTRDLPACSTILKTTAPLRTPVPVQKCTIFLLDFYQTYNVADFKDYMVETRSMQGKDFRCLVDLSED
jgi:hypothetical protein